MCYLHLFRVECLARFSLSPHPIVHLPLPYTTISAVTLGRQGGGEALDVGACVSWEGGCRLTSAGSLVTNAPVLLPGVPRSYPPPSSLGRVGGGELCHFTSRQKRPGVRASVGR